MNQLVATSELLTGLAYTGLGFLTLYEMLHERRLRGWSQFGLAFALMAFTCGPHHLLQAVLALDTAMTPGFAQLVPLLLGLPAGFAFVALRIAALRGNPGDRTIRAGAGLLPFITIVVATIGTAAVTAAALQHGPVGLGALTANAILAASYLAVGWYIITTQLRRYALLKTWSLSGIALGLIFPTCALTHITHALTAHPMGHGSAASAAIQVLDIIGIPASIWFLIVVRRLYHEGLADWNRRPLVGIGLTPRRPAPWDPTHPDRSDPSELVTAGANTAHP